MLNRRADKLELLRIAEAVALEKSIDKELIIDSMESGIAKAAKSKFGSENEIKVEINRENGDIGIFRKLLIILILYYVFPRRISFFKCFRLANVKPILMDRTSNNFSIARY